MPYSRHTSRRDREREAAIVRQDEQAEADAAAQEIADRLSGQRWLVEVYPEYSNGLKRWEVIVVYDHRPGRNAIPKWAAGGDLPVRSRKKRTP